MYNVFITKWESEFQEKDFKTTICGPGRSKMSPAGPPGQPGRQCRPVSLAGRRASLAAYGPAGCDLQVLQLAAVSGRGGEGGGRADNRDHGFISKGRSIKRNVAGEHI